ncbi:MAG: hypothetical protein D6704_05005 [Nitrospirae bacterium]|nr:MAG: hypothetical protein D6704_05005 [Nitrospirota bacterium]
MIEIGVEAIDPLSRPPSRERAHDLHMMEAADGMWTWGPSRMNVVLKGFIRDGANSWANEMVMAK